MAKKGATFIGRWKLALTAGARLDRSQVGITFIDVLFALVVGQILGPLVAWDELPSTAFFHMAVAFVLTVASWIGYHNSFNRPHYFIGFVNLPLWQFCVDALLVIVYWWTAIYIEGRYAFGSGEVERLPSAKPETLFVAASFLLYVVWDDIAKRMRYSDRYKLFGEDLDKGRRRTVSQVCFGLSVIIALMAWWTDPSSTLWICLIDITLIVLLIGYRVAKETVGGRPRIKDEETLEDDFEIVLDRVERIQRQLRERGDFPA